MPLRPPVAATRGPARIDLDWDALEIAVERNSPETDSYLDLTTGRILTITTGDPEAAQHQRFAAAYLSRPTDPRYQIYVGNIELRVVE